MSKAFFDRLSAEISDIREQGLYKSERVITSMQGVEVTVEGRDAPILNFCANNYLGLADDPRIIRASEEAMRERGYGMASVRFICGTQDLHVQLEERLAAYLGYEACITFAACFDANAAVFEPLLSAEDAIISDTLNHASIIDGVRLCKAKRYRFANRDLEDLETQLKAARSDGARTILVVTDGVFSMDGYITDLAGMREICDRYEALIMVDDCHSTGILGERGRGTASHCGVEDAVDILTGTLGKALGGGMGGFICAKAPVIEILRQRGRPYLFSNALAPGLCGGAIKSIDLAEDADNRREQLVRNAARFRAGLSAAGFDLLEGNHPIIPVMLGDAKLAQSMASRLLDEGVYVSGFFYPVVPKGRARIRTQMNAAMTDEHIDRAVAAFTKVRDELSETAEAAQ
jgi:glycine C-acetyltransferase